MLAELPEHLLLDVANECALSALRPLFSANRRLARLRWFAQLKSTPQPRPALAKSEMTLDWLVWYYARALELPFPVLRSLLTHGLPIKQVAFDDRRELQVFGQRHCSYGPAVERAGGTKEWFRNGQWHRDDGPAVEYAHGSKLWYRNGQLHRDDGPAVECADDHKEWWRNGQLHRDDGPAVEYTDGTKAWYRNGQLHRNDGPARIWANGTTEYWRNGVQYWPNQK